MKNKQLSELQIAVLRILWEKGEASAVEVRDGLKGVRSLALTTVSTMLSRLEKQGWVTHRSVGRQFFYKARVSEQKVRSRMLDNLVDWFFKGDHTQLVSHLVGDADPNKSELEELEQRIAAKKKSERKGTK